MLKKILIACLVLFAVNMGCKKTNMDGSAPCGCSPVTGPSINLAITDAAGADLLDEQNPGAYSRAAIKAYYKDTQGNNVPINFGLRPPFDANGEKFKYHLLYLAELNFLKATGTGTVYVKLSDNKTYELAITINTTTYKLQNVLYNQKTAVINTGKASQLLPIAYIAE